MTLKGKQHWQAGVKGLVNTENSIAYFQSDDGLLDIFVTLYMAKRHSYFKKAEALNQQGIYPTEFEPDPD